jgi:ferrous iron transport protein B
MSEIFLVGRPNVGKSFLFNKLTNSNQKIANFAGVTIDKKSKQLPDSDLTITDLPGLYALQTSSADEAVALKHLKESSPEDLICVVIECLKLKTQINYILEIRDWCEKNYRPMILCLNMKDEADYFKIKINSDGLSKLLNLPVFYVSAKTEEGLENFKLFLKTKVWSPPEALILNNDSQISNTDQSNVVADLNKNSALVSEKLKSLISGDFSKVIRTQTQIDRFFLSPVFGPLIFLAFTFILFQSIFSWAEPFMNIIESALTFVSQEVSPLFSGHLQSFIDNAFFAGFGAFLVFTPQIFILTFILSFLEKSGYMARAVLLCHQPLSWFGLHGKSFIPLMTGHACAVPAIYAARNIENDWIRKLTIFVIPLTVCSARIPVYGLLIKVLIPDQTILFGLFGMQGLVFFLMYFFGIFMALLTSALIQALSKMPSANDDFIIELPQYRWPELKTMFSKAFSTTYGFIRNAGPIIFVLNAVIWALSYLPSGTSDLKNSYLAQIGRFLEPVFTPIGLDWIQGVAVLSSFIAREVFVSTLGLLYGLSTDNPDDLMNLDQMKNISLASGLSLLFFFAIALQCMSTVSVMVKEANKKIAYLALGSYLVLAYFVSFCIYQILS